MILHPDSLLNEILSQPTAPFREKQVILKITQALEAAAVPYLIDPVGNIIIGADSQKAYLKKIRGKSSEPVRVFIAHLDHPGFHGVSWKTDSELIVKWHGGSPTQHLAGSKVWLAGPEGGLTEGTLKEATLLPSGKAIDSGIVVCPHQPIPVEKIYGGFQFRAPVWLEGNLLYTKAADDLIGAFALTSLAIRLWKRKRAADFPFLAVLTRAEEVGFIGAIGHFELGWLQQAKREIICVSLETSRTLPGAEIGKGPVVRLGDRMTVFDSGALRILTDLAQSHLPERHQRRIMDGGSCEATAATAYGFPCIGISVPLGNYHNQSLEGGPDAAPLNGPAPEFVHTEDIQGLLVLCEALLKSKLPWSTPWSKKKKEFKKSLQSYRTLLRSGP
jgi:endoglucanase